MLCVCLFKLWFWWFFWVTESLCAFSQVRPSRQAPVPSCQVTQAPPRWPLTPPTGRPIPAVCRWHSSGRRTLTKVNNPTKLRLFCPLSAHNSKTPALPRFQDFFLLELNPQKAHSSSASAPTNRVPFHFCVTAGGSTLSSVLNASLSLSLCPQPVLPFLSPNLCYCNLSFSPSSCSARLSPPLSGAAAPLFSDIFLRALFLSECLCSGLLGEWLNLASLFVPLCLFCDSLSRHIWVEGQIGGKASDTACWQHREKRTNGFQLRFPLKLIASP